MIRRAIADVVAVVAGACLALGCGERADEHSEHADHAEHADRAERAAGPPSGADRVRIDPGMLRDLRITTARAEARVAGETVHVLGELGVDQTAYAEVGAPIAARVAAVLVDVGDRVTRGQVLATLSSPDLGRARADLRGARTRAELAARTVERKRALAAERLVPAAELQAAEAAAAEATAQLEAAAAAVGGLRAARTGDGGLALASPLAGVVIERDVVQGQLAGPEHTLFRVGDLSRLWITTHVFERDAVRVRPGASARVELTAFPGRSFSARVARIGGAVDPVSRTIPVRLEIENPDGALRPGMSASAALPLGDAGGIGTAAAGATLVAVPLAAVQRVGDRWVVFAPAGAGEFAVRPIGRGRELGGELEVLTGLVAGDEVVVDGAFLLKAEADKARGGGGDGHDH